ncbi:MAG: fumarylacetoacetase [Jiangellaceae bacterium]|nr:fumarylacetoacetase [Jiangellaceae bacterium]
MTWIPVPDGSPIGVHTLPYGVFSTAHDGRRVGAAIGDHIVDLAAVAGEQGGADPAIFRTSSLNAFMSRGPRVWFAVREWLTRLLMDREHRAAVEPHLVPMPDAVLHLPFEVADYVDFYASRQHAENLGQIFRPDRPELPKAWRHLPIGYHGRSGTVVPSGTDVIRPNGMRADGGAVSYGPSTMLDIEAEVGFVVAVPSALGQPIPVGRFAEHVFGVVLVNDWSARDIQAFEYVPLGPFLGKSFATSISVWVVPLAALEHARVDPPPRDPKPAEYLRDTQPWGLDITLEVSWNGTTVSRPPFAGMYWTAAQQLAHLTANGACVRTGDLYASGTVSGPIREQYGSFLELSWNGTQPVRLADGSTRTFLHDGDRVTISASAPGPGGSRVGLGEVTGTIRPALR